MMVGCGCGLGTGGAVSINELKIYLCFDKLTIVN